MKSQSNASSTTSAGQPLDIDAAEAPTGSMPDGVVIELHEHHSKPKEEVVQPEVPIPVIIDVAPPATVIKPDPVMTEDVTPQEVPIVPPVDTVSQPPINDPIMPQPQLPTYPTPLTKPAVTMPITPPLPVPEPDIVLPPAPVVEPASPLSMPPAQVPQPLEAPVPAPASAFVGLGPDIQTQVPPAPAQITSVDASQWFRSSKPAVDPNPVPLTPTPPTLTQMQAPTYVSPNFAQPAGVAGQPLAVQTNIAQPDLAALQSVDVGAVGENPERSFLVALVLSYLLGAFGIDRFYLGKTRSAIIKLLTLGGLGVWTAIDLIRTGFGMQHAANDPRPLDGYAKNRSWAKIVTIVLTVVSYVIPITVIVILMIVQTIQLNQREADFEQRTAQTQTTQ